MTTALSYPGEEYSVVLHSIASFLQVQPQNNRLTLPSHFGTGYFFYMDLPWGMQLWLSDFSVYHDFYMVRRKAAGDFFNLRFDIIETIGHSQLLIEDQWVATPRQGAYLLLTSTQFNLAYKAQPGTRAKSINLRFPKQTLEALMEAGNLLQYCVHNPQAAHLIVKPSAETFGLLSDIFECGHEAQPQQLRTLIPCLQLLDYFRTQVQAAVPMSERTGKWLEEDDYQRMLDLETLLTTLGPETPPTLEDLAQQFHMSVSKLKYSFRAVYGTSIYQYYQKARLMKALQYLQEGQSISEVVAGLGFSDASNLNRNFKKAFGISPGKVKQLRLNHEPV